MMPGGRPIVVWVSQRARLLREARWFQAGRAGHRTDRNAQLQTEILNKGNY
jgi:hypothetical protein